MCMKLYTILLFLMKHKYILTNKEFIDLKRNIIFISKTNQFNVMIGLGIIFEAKVGDCALKVNCYKWR